MIDLLAPLNDSQALLIRCIGRPFLESRKWPIWAYIEAELDHEKLEAREVLSTLPEIADTRSGIRYSSVWYDRNSLAQNTSLCLTAAGIYHLAAVSPESIRIGEDFIQALRFLIESRMSARLSPFEVTEVTVTNDDIMEQLPQLSKAFMEILPDLLNHEPATWRGSHWKSPDGAQWNLNLYRELLKYQGVGTVVDYVERVSELLTPPRVEPVPAVPSPLDLVAALDYFNAVWQLHFDRKKPIIRIFGAERTARLVYEVNTAEEFSAQVSCLTDIMKNMQVSGNPQMHGTALERMQALLKLELPQDSAARVENVVCVLRCVTDVRNGLFQHAGPEHRGVSALTQLGIAYPITDWQSAWAIVQRRTIDSFNALREEIQQFHDINAG